MAQFTVDIPDELLAGLVAELSAIPNPPTPEEYFQSSAVELLRQRCEAYKVGPYYTGPIPPQFNADGTLFGVAPAAPEPVATDEAAQAVEAADTNDSGEVTA